MFHSFFITIPGGGKSKIKVPIDLVLDGGPLLVHRWLSYMVEGRRELSEVCFFFKALILFLKALPSWPNHLPEAPFLIPSFGAVDFST